MMRVAIFSHSFLDVETRKMIYELQKSVEVSVILPQTWSSQVFDRRDFSSEHDSDQCFYPLKVFRVSSGQYILFPLSLKLRSIRPDVLHIEYNPWSIMFWQAYIARALFWPRCPIVCTIKKNTYRLPRGVLGKIKESVANAGVKKVTTYMAASRLAQSLLSTRFGIAGSKIHVFHLLGVDLSHFHPRDRPSIAGVTPFTVGFCGRLAEDKGILDLVNVVANLREREGLPLRLSLLGRGPLVEYLESFSRSAPWLTVLDAVSTSEVPDFLRTLDAFVMASKPLPDHEEHDAHALLEAMAVGLPVIGTNVGILPDILANGAGVMIEAGNCAQLSQALSKLWHDPAYRMELSGAALAMAKREFSLEVSAKHRISVYTAAYTLANTRNVVQ